MDRIQNITASIERLLKYAEDKGLISPVDHPYYRNLLLDIMKLEAPGDIAKDETPSPQTATKILNDLCDLAAESGVIENLQYERDLLAARLMGAITPPPKEVRSRFLTYCENNDPEGATQYFYNLCRDCDYIKVDAIAQNIRYFADSPCGKLEITINLSKPEKDPREIAKLKNAPSVGYPKCMLCIENPGYAGRNNFPGRQNHRIVPLTLAGGQWYMQYSPYAYYPEHCIVLNSVHKPMKIDKGTFERMFSFVEQFPHYFIGSNADLPIVGGSILNHDHFQGGCYTFPMDNAAKEIEFSGNDASVNASVLDWPMSVICLESGNKESLINEASRILDAWRNYSDAQRGILCETDGTPHNTITPILRKQGSIYRLMLVLRNNRTTEEYPLGIFHPHQQLHHIKKENIGLIEVMGLFILPGRLKKEFAGLNDYLTGEKDLAAISDDELCAKHSAWVESIVDEYGKCVSAGDADALLRSETASVCSQVLADAGVFKQDKCGRDGFTRFLGSLGYTQK